MSEMRLGWALGMDNVSSEAALPDGAVADAVNVDIDRAGGVTRRPGTTLVTAGNAHSCWSTRDGSRSFVVIDGVLNAISLTSTEAVVTLDRDEPLSYDIVNDAVIAGGRHHLFSIDDSNDARRLGLEVPGAPVNGAIDLSASTTVGGLAAGRYGVALSYLKDGEESGLSYASFITVPANGGIVVSLIQPTEALPTGIRIYRTACDGDILFRAADVPLAISTWTLGESPLGRAAENQFKIRMQGGDIVREWRGRLWVARGTRIYFSEPMNYGLHDPREGFVQMPRRIRVMEPTEGGVYVGTADGVKFLAGTGPKDMKVTEVTKNAPVEGTGRSVPASEFGDIGVKGKDVAFWLATNGFVIGQPDGSLIEAQANRIRLPSGAAGTGAVVVFNRQAVAAVS